MWHSLNNIGGDEGVIMRFYCLARPLTLSLHLRALFPAKTNEFGIAKCSGQMLVGTIKAEF